jgi:hypothetical protein
MDLSPGTVMEPFRELLGYEQIKVTKNLQQNKLSNTFDRKVVDPMGKTLVVVTKPENFR